MNGKGSKNRLRDARAYRANYDAIDWRKDEIPKVAVLPKTKETKECVVVVDYPVRSDRC